LRATSWATALRDNVKSEVLVIASSPKSGSVRDGASLNFAGLLPGTMAIDSTCSSASAACTAFTLAFTIDASGANTMSCSLSAGSISLTTVSSARVSGTFSGSGTCVPKTGAPSSFAVTTGVFDAAFAIF